MATTASEGYANKFLQLIGDQSDSTFCENLPKLDFEKTIFQTNFF